MNAVVVVVVVVPRTPHSSGLKQCRGEGRTPHAISYLYVVLPYSVLFPPQRTRPKASSSQIQPTRCTCPWPSDIRNQTLQRCQSVPILLVRRRDSSEYTARAVPALQSARGARYKNPECPARTTGIKAAATLRLRLPWHGPRQRRGQPTLRGSTKGKNTNENHCRHRYRRN